MALGHRFKTTEPLACRTDHRSLAREPRLSFYVTWNVATFPKLLIVPLALIFCLPCVAFAGTVTIVEKAPLGSTSIMSALAITESTPRAGCAWARSPLGQIR